MKKLLLEYKGIPVIFYYSLNKIDKITFIVVYTNGDNIYERKDFNDIESALDFAPESYLKLTFVLIEEQNEDTIIEYRHLKLVKKTLILDTLILSKAVDDIYKKFKFTVELGLDHFRIRKYDSNKTIYEINYLRRKKIITKFDYHDSYYELIPRFEDIFLETIFMLDIMKSNSEINNKEELEAYFLQAKIKIEKNKKPPTIQQDSDEEIGEEITEEPFEFLNLIGLDKIKLEIKELEALAHIRKERIKVGLPVTPSTLHMVFTGNPGTGKTTVARLLGRIYYDIRLLAENKVIEVSRTDLVGQYVGHTAQKTLDVFNKALGGILFIDEAYSLFKGGNDFGSEAVETLIKLMEDNREKIVVIIAGYPKEIEELLSSNPGLKSRFSKHFHFDDYSKDELIQILNKMVSDYHNKLTDGAKYKIELLIEKNYELGKFNSNARAVRNIFEEMIKKQSHRLSDINNPTQEEMATFVDTDVPDSLD